MKYRIVKATYADNTNLFYAQQKRFLLWKIIDDPNFSKDSHWDMFNSLEYKLFNSFEDAEKALNNYVKKIKANTLIKKEVVSIYTQIKNETIY